MSVKQVDESKIDGLKVDELFNKRRDDAPESKKICDCEYNRELKYEKFFVSVWK